MATKTFLRPFSSKRLLRRRADNKLSVAPVERQPRRRDAAD